MADREDIASEIKEQAILEELRNKIRTLEVELRDTRDMARDTLHIAIGVDGKNGLRSAISELAGTVDRIKEDFMFLRETAHNYRELKNIILKFLLTGVFAFIFQLGGIVWFFSSDHRAQEDLAKQVGEIATDIKQLQKNGHQKDSSN
jgi:hypothetical protein